MDGDPFGLIGRVLDGKFRVDTLVGDGDLSVVYKGFHLEVHAPVAIKCLHLPDTLDPALTRPVVEAFEDAGRLHDRLGRANLPVAQTIATGRTLAPRTGATVPYRVREWFEGESLASDLARRRRDGEWPRTVNEAFALLEPAIDGIAQAHEGGIAHLALDPGKLFLAQDEGPVSLKVLDFGTARARHRADARPTLDSELTRGLHLFHPAYAAPEQLDMELGETGTWTDVYSLALIMMEVLAERSAVEGRDTAALVERAVNRQKRPTPQAHGLKLPRALDLVLTRAVAWSPEGRQKDARVFLNDLKAALGVGAPAKAPSTRSVPARVVSIVPSKPAQPPPPKPAPVPVRARAVERSAAVLVATPPPIPQPEVRPLQPVPQPEVRPLQPVALAEARPQSPAPLPAAPPLPPSPAASGPIAAAQAPQDAPIVPVAPPPSLFPPPASPAPSLVGLEEKLLRRPWSSLWSSRTFRLSVGAAALALALVAVVFAALPKKHATSATAAAIASVVPSAAAVVPSTVTSVARPAVAPVAPAAAPVAAVATAVVAPAVAPPPPVAAVAPPERATTSHAAPAPPLPRFSRAAAQRAINGVIRKVSRCRHGHFWGNGYATVAFANDGSIAQVLVDPPFSMTVTGKCVADSIDRAHMQSFSGRKGYYRFRFYIAP
jgi:serine/threonine-protein kinase